MSSTNNINHFSLQPIVTDHLVITPEPPLDSCPEPRGCNTTAPYPPCLNSGTCSEQAGEDATFTCFCPPNFFGAGCQFFDECSNEPCQNGGTCVMNVWSLGQFACMCPEGYDGDTCEEIIPACSSSPCAEGATCVDVEGEFECQCPPGFTGTLCFEDVDNCEGDPCENGATCSDGVDTFSCMCPPRFTGPTCATPLRFCSPDACENGGTCQEAERGFECSCPPGFTGPRCSLDVDECESLEPCRGGSTCTNLPGTFNCFCPPGLTGTTCETVIDFCSNDTCSGNGACSSLPDGFLCDCNVGYTGERCEVDIDECESVECRNGGTCVEGLGVYMCVCDAGYTGMLCEVDTDACENFPCQNGGTCSDLPGDQFSCECPVGYTGFMCEEQVDFCVDQTCHSGGTCRSLDTSFRCDCPIGWTGDRCQFADNVVVKLDSCGFSMAEDMLADAGLVDGSEALAIQNGSPFVSFQYNLQNARGIYFSGWVWQEADTNSVLFSFTSDDLTSAGQFVSDLPSQELRFQFSSITGHILNTTFREVAPLRPNSWTHVALAVFNENTVLLNVDGSFSARQTLQSEAASGEAVMAGFEVPAVVVVHIGRQVTQLSSLDPAGAFSGLVRGVAINAVRVGVDGFDLDALQECTLGCVGGESPCSASGGQCRDLFGADRQCECSHGYAGLLCQQLHDRFSFKRGSYAQVRTVMDRESLSFSFKTEEGLGELVTHSVSSSASTLIQLTNNRSLELVSRDCDGTPSSLFFFSSEDLNNLQYHTISLSDTVQLNSGEDFTVPSPPACNETSTSSLQLGGGAFQGCLRDVFFNQVQLDSSLLQFSPSGGAEFGCSRDVARFHVLSHLELPQFLSRQSQRVRLEFSTLSPSGLLYFSRRVPADATGDMPNDFIAVHIEAGRPVFTFNLGEQDMNVILSSEVAVDDGAWHTLTAVHNMTMAALYVDGVLVQAESMGPLVLLDTTGSVFVGGVPAGSRIAGFGAYAGFDGCVRDLEQNGSGVDLQDHTSQDNVRFGICN